MGIHTMLGQALGMNGRTAPQQVLPPIGIDSGREFTLSKPADLAVQIDSGRDRALSSMGLLNGGALFSVTAQGNSFCVINAFLGFGHGLLPKYVRCGHLLIRQHCDAGMGDTLSELSCCASWKNPCRNRPQTYKQLSFSLRFCKDCYTA